jgi:hypothetical protein
MRRIIFLLSGPGHLPNLAVALFTLRKHYVGPIDVFSWKESLPIVKQICSDSRLNVGYIPWEPLYHGHSDTYVDKTRLIQSLASPSNDAVLFLDADITVHGNISPLFACIEKYGFVATQFNDWVTTGNTISGRIKTLEQFPEIDQMLINQALERAWPSVNTGIFGGRPDSPVLPLWHRWTYAAKASFIPDEKVMHLMMVKFGPSNELAVATDGAWNCSPKLQPKNLPDDQVKIFHFHGDSNLRPSKSKRGFDLWSSVYKQAMELNIGNMQDWVLSIPNKHLQKLFVEKEL